MRNIFLCSADELLLTEMIFNGLFNNLTSAQVAAILSCFVCDEKSNDMPKLTETLSGPLRQMQEMARRIAKVSKECKIELDEDLYVEAFRPHMMDIVHEWCKGASFLQICKMTDIFEGTVMFFLLQSPRYALRAHFQVVLSAACGVWKSFYAKWFKPPRTLATQNWKTDSPMPSSS